MLLSKTGPFVSLPTERFDERGLTRDIHTFPNGAIIPRKIEVAKNLLGSAKSVKVINAYSWFVVFCWLGVEVVVVVVFVLNRSDLS